MQSKRSFWLTTIRTQIKVNYFENVCNSFLDYLKAPLERYIKRFPIPIRLVHLEERSGLIRARLKGSEMAKGKVSLEFSAIIDCWGTLMMNCLINKMLKCLSSNHCFLGSALLGCPRRGDKRLA